MDVSDFTPAREIEIEAQDGQNVGELSAIHADGDSVIFAEVKMGPHDRKGKVIPVTRASLEGNTLKVPYTVKQISRGPELEEGRALTAGQTKLIMSHYNEEPPEVADRSQRTGKVGSEREVLRQGNARIKVKNLPPRVRFSPF
ncbi:hypothetical protein [Streptomyces sp. NPDC001286]